jgi:hypothetical protein
MSDTTSGRLASPLGAVQGEEGLPSGDLAALRRSAWRLQGVVVLRLSDIRDGELRQAVRAEAERLYGKREVA